MRNSKRSSSSKSNLKSTPKSGTVLTLMVTAMLCCVGIRAIVRAYSGPVADFSATGASAAAVVARPSSPPPKVNPNQRPVRIEGEIITISRGGFEPTEITRPKGRFAVFVENRSGLEGVTLRLDRIAGNRLRDVNVPRDKLDWDDVLDLTPGQYVITEAGHPDWVCTITITPN